MFLSFYDWYCDLPPGEPITWGVQTEACECADWFNAKYIVMWGSNVVQTRIPDAHFAFEARYNGAKLCVVSPDYNSSAIHADHFLQIQPGTDALLAMGLAKLLIDNKWIKRDYILEQTDMPLLVRKDNGKFLRESDLKKDGGAEVFYLWDQHAKRPDSRARAAWACSARTAAKTERCGSTASTRRWKASVHHRAGEWRQG